MDLDDARSRFLADGYLVFERAFPDQAVDTLRGIVCELMAELAPTTLYSERSQPGTIVPTLAGLTFYRLLVQRPEVAPLMFDEQVLRVIRAILGPDVVLEAAGAIVSDRERPFVEWHTHLDGGGDGRYRRLGWPRIDAPRRLLSLLYLDDLRDGGGALRVHPRRAGASTAPPHDLDSRDWPGQVELALPRGSLVLLDECTWHAAPPTSRPGLRVHLGSYYRAGSAPASQFADPTLGDLPKAAPALASLIGLDAAPSGVGHARELRERGYCVLENAWSREEVTRLREGVEESVRRAALGRMWSEVPEGDEVMVTASGVVITRFFAQHPDLAELLIKPEVVAVLREAFDGPVALETAVAGVSDASRPFVRWHTHIGGLDDGEHREGPAGRGDSASVHWPHLERIERVGTLLYLDELDDETGPLLVYPRAVGDPTAPPHPSTGTHWDGEVALRAAPGTLVILEQCTWHAAERMSRSGHRSWIGCYYRPAALPAPRWVDESLRALASRAAALESVLGEP
ncbi:MAG: phytanoyl-CoA dioxygenase family protein [Polyangiaceae bacterium]|nr:phytanoyl-CoA dioxygenase family protein [Polyangiaceae bacterium]